MKSTILAFATLAAFAALFAPRSGVGVARADQGKLASVGAASGPACVLKGTFPGPKGTSIFDAPSGGRAVAAFTGAQQPMTLSDFPADPTAGRARIATSVGAGAFRVEGWVAPSAIAVFTTRDLPIAPDHVWIASARRVRLVQAASGSLTAEMGVPGTSGQTVRAPATCDAYSLQPGTPTPMAVPGNARGYLTRGSSLELRESAGGAVIFTLKSAEGTAQLFWSNESRAGFVHVRARDSLVIDAWARLRDLEPLKKGEMMDQFAPPTTAVAAASLQLDGSARLVKATRDIPFRPRREEKEKTIGVIEAGAEIYVLETLLGWANVLPKDLGLTPAQDGGFWIPSGDVPK